MDYGHILDPVRYPFGRPTITEKSSLNARFLSREASAIPGVLEPHVPSELFACLAIATAYEKLDCAIPKNRELRLITK